MRTFHLSLENFFITFFSWVVWVLNSSQVFFYDYDEWQALKLKYTMAKSAVWNRVFPETSLGKRQLEKFQKIFQVDSCFNGTIYVLDFNS